MNLKMLRNIFIFKTLLTQASRLPIPAVERSNASVCDRSLAGIVGSNTAGGMAVFLLSIFCVFS